jgi:hypothetical protein
MKEILDKIIKSVELVIKEKRFSYMGRVLFNGKWMDAC